MTVGIYIFYDVMVCDIIPKMHSEDRNRILMHLAGIVQVTAILRIATLRTDNRGNVCDKIPKYLL